MQILSDTEKTLSILKTEKHQLEGRVTSTETEEDGARLALEKERAALPDAEEALSTLKTEKHELEERVSSAETERGGARLVLEKELTALPDAECPTQRRRCQF